MFELPVIDAVNCCVLPTGTVAVGGRTETATVGAGVRDEEPAQPHNKTETQLRARDITQRIKILSGGLVGHVLNAGIKGWTAPKAFTH
jgi:hypothetical protein